MIKAQLVITISVNRRKWESVNIFPSTTTESDVGGSLVSRKEAIPVIKRDKEGNKYFSLLCVPYCTTHYSYLILF